MVEVTAGSDASTTPTVGARDGVGPARILVGLDGTRGSERAMAWALRLARRNRSALRVLRAYDPPEAWPAAVADGLRIDGAWVARVTRQSALDHVERVLRDQAADERTAPPIEVDAIAGHPVDVLATASEDADMLVVGHREIGRVRATVLGSTALNLLILARCPMTVIPPADETAPDPARPDRSTVVVGVDRSAGSRLAMRHALEEATSRGSRVLAITAFQAVVPGPDMTPMAEPSAQEVRHAIESDVRPFVDEITAGFALDHRGVAPPVDLQVWPSSPVWALVDAARDAGADLIVLGHRGRGLLATRLLGSVGHGVLLHASCPVTMVPEPDDAAPELEAAPTRRATPPLAVGPIA